MEKRIFIAVCAAMALTGKVQASAPIMNALSRFMLTGAGVGGASLYAAEKYPTAFNRVSFLLKSSEVPTPVSTPIDQNTLVMQAQTSKLLKALEGPTLTREMMPFVLKSGAIALTTFVAWDLTCGNGYTRKLMKVLEEKLVTLSNNAKAGFVKLNNKIKILYGKLVNIEVQNKKTEQKVEQNGQTLEKLEQKINALLRIQQTESPENRRIVERALALETEQSAKPADEDSQEEKTNRELMNQDIIFENQKNNEPANNSGSLSSKISSGLAWASSWFNCA